MRGQAFFIKKINLIKTYKIIKQININFISYLCKKNEMKKIFILIIISFNGFYTECYPQPSTTINIGLELDVLPYATNGYFGAIWIGRNHFRGRLLTANVNKPDWTTKNGFKSHKIQAFAFVADYFPERNWKKWWMGGGPVIWKSNISDDSGVKSNSFTNFLINGSLGYNFKFGNHFYICPWMGLSLNVAGDNNISVGKSIYSLPFFNPELSLKIGAFL